jgi:hypothetical protein
MGGIRSADRTSRPSSRWKDDDWRAVLRSTCPASRSRIESPTDPISLTESPASGKAAVAALAEARRGDRRGPARADARLHLPGLAQLSRYLERSWSRAGISPQRHDDCTQEVYLTLLEGWGPDRFQRLLGDIDRLDANSLSL